jgi:hypothetical protein
MEITLFSFGQERLEGRSPEPSLAEMELLVAQAERCLRCVSAPVPGGERCYEFTPGGVETCSDLPWWNNKPVLPETLKKWKEIVVSYRAVPHRSDD